MNAPEDQKSSAAPGDFGVSGALYAVVRLIATLLLRGWFRVRIVGREHVPSEGPAIIAPNHKNFLDPFFVGLATTRRVHFMAKAELFKGPMGWFFSRLGAFPVRRGEGDADALSRARAILEAGGLLVIFPEGTRVEQLDALGSPHHGAGRLAVETNAPIVPAAITGTSHLWRGAIPKLKRVQLTFLAPVAVGSPDPQPDAVSELIDRRVWPAVREEYGRMRASPGLIVAAAAAIGIGGLLARRQFTERPPPRLLDKLPPRRKRRRRIALGRRRAR